MTNSLLSLRLTETVFQTQEPNQDIVIVGQPCQSIEELHRPCLCGTHGLTMPYF